MPGAYPLFEAGSATTGGAELNLYHLARGLAQLPDMDVEFFVQDRGQPEGTLHAGIRLARMPYENAVQFPGLRYQFMRRTSFLQMLARRPRSVYLTSTANEYLFYMTRIARLRYGARVVFRLAHDRDATPASYWRRGSRFLYFAYRLGLGAADQIVSQTEDQRRLLRRHTGLESRVIRNGLDLSAYEMPASAESRRFVLWVSRLKAWKRPERMVDLARALPHMNFVMICPGSAEERERLQKAAADCENIEWVSGAPPNEIHCWFREALCFVNTSEAEGFPNTFLQACAAGVPILSLRVNPDGMLGPEGPGVCVNDSIGDAVAYLQRLDAREIEMRGAKGRRYLQEYHALSDRVAEYADMLRSLDPEASAPGGVSSAL